LGNESRRRVVPMNDWRILMGVLAVASLGATEPDEGAAMARFEAAKAATGELLMSDDGAGDWHQGWWLDGEVATVKNTQEGMELRAGAEIGNQAHHMVLWTNQTFGGDVRMDYDFTRLDEAKENVNILYLFATGMGEAPYETDIKAWRELRTEPRMASYFNKMNTYHVSYAAYDQDNSDPTNDYVRARRYRPDLKRGLEGTALMPDYDHTGMFATGVPHHITVIRRGDDLFFYVSNAERSRLFHWSTAQALPIESGYIGLRQMWGRSARYAKVKIWALK
jgi:hypothetical protein